jgi:hypothetical protein
VARWRPIRTAPRDETEILIARSGKECVSSMNVVYYNDTDLGTKKHPWVFVDGTNAYHKDFPTHWMPLPKPPVRNRLARKSTQ